MNKAFFLSLLLFLIIVPLASATPVIQDISINPPYLWIGESTTISLNCFDNDSTINQVYANIVGPGITIPTIYFANNGGGYVASVDKEYIDRTGQFDVNIYCKNDNNEITSALTDFTVSRLDGYISGIIPTPAYTGETMEIDFIVEKNDIRLDSNVTFSVWLNDQLTSLKVLPAYDVNKGWMLKINPPSNGTYYVKVTAFYDRINATNYSSIVVDNNIEFSIASVDKNWIESNDNITVTLIALEKNNLISLNSNNINIKINSVNAQITTISQRGNLFDVGVVAPSLPPGRYTLQAYLNHDGNSYSDSGEIDYIVPIEGGLVDSNNMAINAKIKFIQNGITKLILTTDAYGHYSGSLPPDNYDMEFDFPRSTLYLYGVSVNSFDDPVKYVLDDSDMPGIRNAGLYEYEIDLSYSSADVEMSYNEKNVVNENNLKIFQCSNWNSGRKECNSEWNQINGGIDAIRNRVRINSTVLSTFVIGEVKSISVDFSLDKDAYNPGDTIKIRGLVKDVDGNSVKNASVEVSIKNTQISSKVTADNNGIFSAELQAPSNEGSYELDLKANEYPYIEFNGNKNFILTKSKSVFMDFPDAISINKGENLTQNFSLINNGQADIDNLKVYFEGISESYYNFSENTSLKAGEEKTFYLRLSIPFYADTGVSSATLKIEGKNISQEKIFGLSIAEKGAGNEGKNVTLPSTGLASGFAIPNISSLEAVYISLFAVICFSASILLKKMNIKKNNREIIKKSLFDSKFLIKKDLIKDRIQENFNVKNQNIYDKVILTEFPNFLKFSKNLVQKNMGGDDGKDN
jgi:hypothetical protein